MLPTMLSVCTQQLCGKLLRRDAQSLADLLPAVRLRMQHLIHQNQHLVQRGIQLCLHMDQFGQPTGVKPTRLGQHLRSNQSIK